MTALHRLGRGRALPASALCGLLVLAGGCTTEGPGLEATAAPPGRSPSAPTAPTATPLGPLAGHEVQVGVDPISPPFGIADGDAVVGIDADLIAAICGRAGCEADVRPAAWDGIFDALAAREHDLLAGGIAVEPGRERDGHATFTVPYLELAQVALVRRPAATEAPEGGLTPGAQVAAPATVAAEPPPVAIDLREGEVGVAAGTAGDIAATEVAGVPEERVRRFATIAEAVDALRDGEVDAVVTDGPMADAYVRALPESFVTAGEPLAAEAIAMLVSSDVPEVLAAFDAAILELRAAGEIDAIVRRWADRCVQTGCAP